MRPCLHDELASLVKDKTALVSEVAKKEVAMPADGDPFEVALSSITDDVRTRLEDAEAIAQGNSVHGER